MECDEVRTLLAGYADGELSPLERETVEAHLAACGRCRALRAGQKRIQHVLESYTPPPVSDEKWNAIARRLRAELEGTRQRPLQTRSRIEFPAEPEDVEPPQAPMQPVEAVKPPTPSEPTPPARLSLLGSPRVVKRRRPRFWWTAHLVAALASAALLAAALAAARHALEAVE